MSSIEVLLNLVISAILIFYGSAGLFFSKKVIHFIKKIAGKKWNDNLENKKWFLLNIKIGGFTIIFFAVIVIWLSIQSIK